MTAELEVVHNYFKQLLHEAQMCAAPVLERGPARLGAEREWLIDQLREVPPLSNRPVIGNSEAYDYGMVDWCLRQLVFTVRMAVGRGIDVREAWAHES